MSPQLNKLFLSNRNLIFKDGRSVSFEQKLRLKSQGFRSRKIRLCASGIEELVQGEALQEAIRIHPVPKDFQYSFARSPRFKQNLEDAINDQITACTHSFHETMWLLTDLLSFSRKSLLKNAYTPSYSWTIRPKEGEKYFYRLSCHLSLSLSMHRRAVGFMRLS